MSDSKELAKHENLPATEHIAAAAYFHNAMERCYANGVAYYNKWLPALHDEWIKMERQFSVVKKAAILGEMRIKAFKQAISEHASELHQIEAEIAPAVKIAEEFAANPKAGMSLEKAITLSTSVSSAVSDTEKVVSKISTELNKKD